MGAGKGRCVLAVLVAGVALAAPAQASAAVTIGSDLEPPPPNVNSCPSMAPCTLANVAPGTLPLTSPIDGVVVRWRIRSATGNVDVNLNVLRETGTGAFTGVSTSQTRALGAVTGAPTLTFPTRQRIRAGDYIGLTSSGFIVVAAATGPTDGYAQWAPPLADGDTRSPSQPLGTLELLLNADVEPDTDDDGFGDETQDDCPGSPGTRNGCETTPPETTITKAPKRKLETRKRKRKVRFKFISSEPGSDFRCVVDDEPPAACDSPFKEKFRRGKHRFEVEAIDAADNADPTPAIAKFKLKRRRHKR